jgi:hypothetical protein
MDPRLAAVKLAFRNANPRPASLIRFDEPAASDSLGRFDEGHGGWVYPITIVLQPFGANSTAENRLDLQAAAGGERVEKYFSIWTETALRTSDEDLQTQADRIEMPDGRVLKIVSVYQRDEAAFTKAIAGLLGDRGRVLQRPDRLPDRPQRPRL